MIVQRNFTRVKPGRVQEAIALLKDIASKHSLTLRVYQPQIGVEFRRICYEIEYEDLAALAKSSEEWAGTTERAEFMAKWADMIEGIGHSEIWKLAD